MTIFRAAVTDYLFDGPFSTLLQFQNHTPTITFHMLFGMTGNCFRVLFSFLPSSCKLIPIGVLTGAC